MQGAIVMKKQVQGKGPVLLALSLLLVFQAGCRRDEDGDTGESREQRLDRLLQTHDRQFQEYLATAQREMGKEILKYSSVSNDVAIPKRMDVSGSHYEYGSLVGRIARLYGQDPRRVAVNRREFNDRIMDMYRRVYPQYLEFARGLGEVFGMAAVELDFVYLEYEFFINLWYRLFKYDEFRSLADTAAPMSASTHTHCSMLFAKIGKDVFVGRNFDDDHEKPQFVEFSSMEDGYKVLANACYIPYHWVMDGVNEKGVFMGTANLVQPRKYYWDDAYPDVPAICEHHLFRVALETCATVEEVIALYRSIRPWSHATDHLLVADALGNSAVIEFNLDRGAVFFPADKDYQIMTNIAYQEGLDYMLNNCSRFSLATSMAENGILAFADVEHITRAIRGSDHGYTSLFDLRKRFMQLYRRLYFYKSFDFTLPQQRQGASGVGDWILSKRF
jgi:predicted choloylglycine hydrolase